MYACMHDQGTHLHAWHVQLKYQGNIVSLQYDSASLTLDFLVVRGPSALTLRSSDRTNFCVCGFLHLAFCLHMHVNECECVCEIKTLLFSWRSLKVNLRK